ncbi:MAG: MBOAT family O-acyltransferase [Chloroflexota bacterium]
MLFNSIEFLIFFPVIFLLLLLVRGKWRWGLLLGASYYFYMSWQPEYIILILISTLVDYLVTLGITSSNRQSVKNSLLAISIVVNLGLLVWFKYATFLATSTNATLTFIGVDGRLHVPALLLPVGISFYTFQTLSYTIDVYRGKVEREANPIVFALFVSYFPQLVAGPIERSKDLLPQLRAVADYALLNANNIASGLRLMAWGMFKKVVVADRLAVYVDTIYDDPTSYRGLAVILATVFFAFQIYCDFSGYSDIAIGVARTLGVKLSQNFNAPYFARSIPEFWRRWHITLSTWFRDYLYIPLGGNRVPDWRWRLNIIIVFAVSGLWHGVNWTFVIWGLIHGGLYLVNHYGGQLLPLSKTRRNTMFFITSAQIGLTFICVCVAWIFFRASTFNDAMILLQNIVAFDNANWQYAWYSINFTVGGQLDIILPFIGIAIVLIVDAIIEWIPEQRILASKFEPVRLLAYAMLLFSILFFGLFGAEQQFVYFQF